MPKHLAFFSKGMPKDLPGGEDPAFRVADATIDGAAAGAVMRVRRVTGGRRLVHRLAALGMVPGAIITVTRPRGPALVAIGSATIALSRQAARSIEVEAAAE